MFKIQHLGPTLMTYLKILSNLFYQAKYGVLSIFKSKYTHIYIDESFCEKSSLATLTAIFIPQRKLGQITADFYKVISLIIEQFPNKKNGSRFIYSAPVLHGNSLLRINPKKDVENKGWDFSAIEDDFRIKIFNEVINIIRKNKLKIVRLGYNNYNELKKRNFTDNRMHNTIWVGLSSYIDRSYEVKKAICVMDGNATEMIRAFSTFISGAKMFSYVYPDLEKSSVFTDSKKFIGNVFFVPARYCEFLQIVDLISYILHKKDYLDITGEWSEFSKKIYNLSFRLEDYIAYNKLYTLKIDPQ